MCENSPTMISILTFLSYINHCSCDLGDWCTDQLHQACEGAVLRGSRVISAEDILFLMRRDKVK